MCLSIWLNGERSVTCTAILSETVSVCFTCDANVVFVARFTSLFHVLVTFQNLHNAPVCHVFVPLLLLLDDTCLPQSHTSIL